MTRSCRVSRGAARGCIRLTQAAEPPAEIHRTAGFIAPSASPASTQTAAPTSTRSAVIRMKLRAEAERLPLYAKLKEFGCDAEASARWSRSTFPPMSPTSRSLPSLTQGQKDDRWGFEEAVLYHESPFALEGT